ncbi:hypothetical protein QF031_000969 [Pseudarthrobacter defluvii]|nr:hypothetical protein [Pseudarthrobacter defluvii]MDQ0768220.1 hypothetical protein [Pseudarthrobacter defluvii]
MTTKINSNHATAADTSPISIEDLDLTPEGLADTPAHQEDTESIVHIAES